MPHYRGMGLLYCHFDQKTSPQQNIYKLLQLIPGFSIAPENKSSYFKMGLKTKVAGA